MAIVKKTINERVCDICHHRITNKFNDYSCKLCGKKDLCSGCRIRLSSQHKHETQTYTYETIQHGYICIDCFKSKFKGEINGKK
jgi:hypothetical protein